MPTAPAPSPPSPAARVQEHAAGPLARARLADERAEATPIAKPVAPPRTEESEYVQSDADAQREVARELGYEPWVPSPELAEQLRNPPPALDPSLEAVMYGPGPVLPEGIQEMLDHPPNALPPELEWVLTAPEPEIPLEVQRLLDNPPEVPQPDVDRVLDLSDP